MYKHFSAAADSMFPTGLMRARECSAHDNDGDVELTGGWSDL